MKPAKILKSKATIHFKTDLNDKNILILPKNISTKLSSQGKSLIEGTANNFPFRASLKTNKNGDYSLEINKTTSAVLSKSTLNTVTVEITGIGEEKEPRVPTDFSKALASNPIAKKLWEDITPIARRDWIFWIITAKKPETRKKRIFVACSKLSGGMRRVCCFPGINWLLKNG